VGGIAAVTPTVDKVVVLSPLMARAVALVRIPKYNILGKTVLWVLSKYHQGGYNTLKRMRVPVVPLRSLSRFDRPTMPHIRRIM